MQKNSITSRLINSSLVLLITRMLQRSLGLLSTLLLARLLTPQDFGLVAIATLVLYFFKVLSVSGINEYLIQKDIVSNDELNSAWSLDLFLKAIMWITLIIATPYLSDFFQDQTLEGPLYAISVVILCYGLRNPQIILLERNLQYQKLFWPYLLEKVVGFVTCVSLALIYESFWAMIVGQIAAAVTFTICSYAFFPARPNFSTNNWAEQWIFSRWMLFKGVLGFGRTQIDTLLIAKIFPVASLGQYNLMKNITVMPSTEIIVPLMKPLLSAFSRIKSDHLNLVFQARVALITVISLITPLCTLMYTQADLIVAVLLGDQWIEGSEIFANLSILLFAFSLGFLANNFCISLGKAKTVFLYDFISFLAITATLSAIAFNPTLVELHEFALIRALLGCFLVAMFLIYITKTLKLKLGRVIYLSLPFISSAFISFISIEVIFSYFELNIALLKLLLHCLLYAFFYITCIGIFYIIFLHKEEEIKSLKRALQPFIKKLIARWEKRKIKRQ